METPKRNSGTIMKNNAQICGVTLKTNLAPQWAETDFKTTYERIEHPDLCNRTKTKH